MFGIKERCKMYKGKNAVYGGNIDVKDITDTYKVSPVNLNEPEVQITPSLTHNKYVALFTSEIETTQCSVGENTYLVWKSILLG
jgi:hypothetical protein